VSQWIIVGLPDEKAIKKACSKSTQVTIYSYGGSAAVQWWSGLKNIINKFNNLSIITISQATSTGLTTFTERTMKLQSTFQDNTLWLSSASANLEINLEILKAPTLL
jgi:uncharacterized protein YaeQ